MDRIDSSLVALRRILRATERFGRELAQSARLSAAQFRVLQMVAETGQTTATRVSQRMRVSQASVTALVDKLELQHLVVREKSLLDGRQKNIVITETGRQTIKTAPDALQQRYVRKFCALQDWEQAMLVASLERVATLLDAEDMDAAPVLDSGDLRKPG